MLTPITIHFKYLICPAATYWWMSTVAIIVYVIIAIFLIQIISQLGIRHQRDKAALEIHAREEEAKEEKLNFFVNLSHEIRSAMSLFIAPLDRLIETDDDPERQRSYAIMKSSAEKVLQIVNQTLDVRKIEKGQLKLSFSPVKIVDFVASICGLFAVQAESKGVDLSFRYSGTKETEVWLDAKYFDKVIINLLSNAIKYTPCGGSVSVLVTVNLKDVSIEVKDTGVGMSDEDIKNVFKRFYQGSNAVSGTGIGLNLAEMLTDLHHGTLVAGHNPDCQGSVFTVRLPLGNAHLSENEISKDEKPLQQILTETLAPPLADLPLDRQTGTGRHQTILVADDNENIRQYLVFELSSEYRVFEARDGVEAYSVAVRERPDLIVSDVVMSEMGGMELCKKIRKNPNTISIPVILLTARTQEQDRMEAMDVGADAYITKPFNISVLKKTISNLLSGRERLKTQFSEPKVKDTDIREVSVMTPDDRLLERVIKVVNENLDNPALTVEQVADEVGISRVHLHRKLKELTNQTSRDFIRNIRLKKAAELLSQKKHSISALSEAVGFSNPTTFSSAFKELYGVSPSEYRQQVLNGQG